MSEQPLGEEFISAQADTLLPPMSKVVLEEEVERFLLRLDTHTEPARSKAEAAFGALMTFKKTNDILALRRIPLFRDMDPEDCKNFLVRIQEFEYPESDKIRKEDIDILPLHLRTGRINRLIRISYNDVVILSSIERMIKSIDQELENLQAGSSESYKDFSVEKIEEFHEDIQYFLTTKIPELIQEADSRHMAEYEY